jgi:hypothetical protein
MTGTTTPSVTPQLILRHDGFTEGADPRSIPAATLRAAGHEPGSLLHVIREKCLDCCCGQAAEVRRCTAYQCPLWPYRLASNPFLRGRTNSGSFGAKNHGASREIFAPNSQPADLTALSS